jgi:hypothetical protein
MSARNIQKASDESRRIINDLDKTGFVMQSLKDRGIEARAICGCVAFRGKEMCDYENCPNGHVVIVPHEHYNVLVALMDEWERS